MLAALWLAGFAVGARALAADRPARRSTADALVPDAARGSPEPPSARGADPARDLRLLAAALEPRALSGLGAEAAAERAKAWCAQVSSGGQAPIAALGELLPPVPWFQARLIMERDEPTLEGNAAVAGASGRAYAEILEALPEVKASSAALEAALLEIWKSSSAAGRLARGPVAPVSRSQRWLPPKDSLDASHRYALDIFFTSVRRSGAEETGPAVKSITRGIVVAMANDWKGGDTLDSYAGGGLSPKSGNGVIVFCPDDGRYYAYFHLKDVSVRPGQVIPAGQLLGHGGNTGANARKKGHGEHLHIEVHTALGQALSSYELRSFVLGLK